MSRIRAIRNKLQIALFVGALWAPLLGSAPALWESETNAADRQPPTLELTLSSVRRFPRAFEAYYRRQVGFRNTMLQTYGQLRVDRLGLSTTEQVLLGRDGWLFSEEEEQVAYLTGRLRFSYADLEAWRHTLEGRRDRLAEQGVRYLFVVVPYKSTIYPEHLPAAVAGARSRTLMDQLVAHLREHSDLTLVDLREPLRREKARRQVYWKTDAHWTPAGAWAGYRAILERLPKAAGEPLAWDDLVQTVEPFAGDLQMMLAVGNRPEPGLFLAPRGGWQAREVAADLPPGYPWPRYVDWSRPVAMERPERSGRSLRLVMFHDSMTFRLRPYLSEHFRRSLYIFHTDAQTAVPDRASLDLIVEQERPDIVIEERSEMYLRDLPIERPVYTEEQEAESSRRFEASSESLLRIDRAEQLDAISQVQVMEQEGAILLRSSGDDPSVKLPKVRFPDGKTLVVRIEITAPTDTVLQLFYLTRGDRRYDEKRSVRIPLAKGFNRRTFALAGRHWVGRLRLDPGFGAGDFVLHGLEVRGVPARGE